jgi:FixJ family two-component response regulator
MNGLIYIVDDNTSLDGSLVGLLEDEGYKVLVFGSAEAFLTFSPTYTPCCILLGVKMPGISGFDLQLKLNHRDFAPPIVFLTGNNELSEAVWAVKKGAVDYLVKPVGTEQLLSAIEEAVAKSEVDTLFYASLENLEQVEREAAILMRQRPSIKDFSGLLDNNAFQALFRDFSDDNKEAGLILNKLSSLPSLKRNELLMSLRHRKTFYKVILSYASKAELKLDRDKCFSSYYDAIFIVGLASLGGENISLKGLYLELGYSKSSCIRLVQSLENLGIFTSIADPSDGRRTKVALSKNFSDDFKQLVYSGTSLTSQ